jgi:hypothetical protein
VERFLSVDADGHPVDVLLEKMIKAPWIVGLAEGLYGTGFF